MEAPLDRTKRLKFFIDEAQSLLQENKIISPVSNEGYLTIPVGLSKVIDQNSNYEIYNKSIDDVGLNVSFLTLVSEDIDRAVTRVTWLGYSIWQHSFLLD